MTRQPPPPPDAANIVTLPRWPAAAPEDAPVELIGFLTADDRDLWIDDPQDIAAIMAFIRAQNIQIRQD